MANEALLKALGTSGSGFDSVLGQVMQTTQNMQKSLMMKQQAAMKLDQQKQLVDYRTNAQLEANKELYGLKQQRTQAETARQTQEELYEKLNEEIDNADNAFKEFNREFGKVSYYGLMNPTFKAGFNQEQGRFTTQTYLNGKAVGTAEYEQRLNNASQTAQKIDDALDALAKGELATQAPEGAGDGIYLTANNVESYVEQLRDNPELADRFVNDSDKIRIARVTEDIEAEGEGDGSRGGGSGKSPLAEHIYQLNNMFGFDPVKSYNAVGDLSWMPTGTTEGKVTIDLNQGVGKTKEKIQEFFNQFGVDISTLPVGSETWDKVKNGDRSGLGGELDDYSKRIKWLRENDDVSRSNVDELFMLYEWMDQVPRIYAREEGQDPTAKLPPPEHMGINLNKTPDQNDSFLFYDMRERPSSSAESALMNQQATQKGRELRN